MWFDPYKALAEPGRNGAGHIPASLAIPAIAATRPDPEPPRLAGLAGIAAPGDLDPETLALALDSFGERAAICEFDGGQARPEAERTALHEAAGACGMAPEVLACAANMEVRL